MLVYNFVLDDNTTKCGLKYGRHNVVVHRMRVCHTTLLFLILTLALNVTECQGCLSHHSIAAHPLNLVQNKKCIDTWFLGILKECHACHPKIIIRIRITVLYIYTDIFNYIHIYVNVWLKSCSLTFWHISFIGSVLKGDFDTMTWPAAKWRCVAGAVAGKKAMPWMARSFHGNGQEVIKSTAILVKCISEDLPLRPHAGVSESMEIISI